MNIRENIPPKSILDSICKPNNTKFSRKHPALQWGIDNEKVALMQYQKQYKGDIKVVDFGLFINPEWPWLGCSPDGIIFDNENKPIGCVEVKCPYSKRDLTIDDCCEDKNFFMRKTTDGIKLKNNHVYFYQCQGVVNLTNLNWIDFVIFTSKSLFVQRITKDNALWHDKMLPKLTSFYQKYMLQNN